jgi:ABC-type polysaccharide/polyol phosphate export permease
MPSASSDSLIANKAIVSKVYFPLLPPISTVVTKFADFLIAAVIWSA